MGKRHDPSSPYADAEGNVTTYENSFKVPGQGVAGNVLGAIGGFLSSGDPDPHARPNTRNTVGAGGRPVLPGARNPNTGAVSGAGMSGGAGGNARTNSGISSWGLPNILGTSAGTGTAARTPRRTGNTATESNGARSTNSATARTGWGIFGGTTGAERIGMGSSRTANSLGNAVISTEAQRRDLPVTAHNQALRQPGARPPGGNVQTTNASGGTTTRVFNPGALNRTNASGNQVIRTQSQLNALR